MALQRTRGLSAAQFLWFAGRRSAVQAHFGSRSPLNAVALGLAPVRYALALVAIILAAILFKEILDAIRSYYAARWQSTPGRLKRWNIHHDADAEDTRIVIRDIGYVYRVAGKVYESSRIGFGFPTRMSVLYLDKTLKRLLGSAPEVLVFFDPANPGRSVLSVGVQMHHLIKVLGIGFVMVLVLALFYSEP